MAQALGDVELLRAAACFSVGRRAAGRGDQVGERARVVDVRRPRAAAPRAGRGSARRSAEKVRWTLRVSASSSASRRRPRRAAR